MSDLEYYILIHKIMIYTGWAFIIVLIAVVIYVLWAVYSVHKIRKKRRRTTNET